MPMSLGQSLPRHSTTGETRCARLFSQGGHIFCLDLGRVGPWPVAWLSKHPLGHGSDLYALGPVQAGSFRKASSGGKWVWAAGTMSLQVGLWGCFELGGFATKAFPKPMNVFGMLDWVLPD